MSTTPTPLPDVATLVWNRPAQNETVTVTVPTAILQLLDWLAANTQNQQGQKYINTPNVVYSDVFSILIPRWIASYQQGQMAVAQAAVTSAMAGIQASIAQVSVDGMPTWAISGTITGGALSTVSLSGAAAATATADANGNFSFTGLGNGNYTVTPSKVGVTFTPASAPVTVNGANVPGVTFTGA